MLYQDCIEELTGWKDLIIKEVKNVFGELHIYGRMKKRIHDCPNCGEKTSKVHDYRQQTVKDVSAFGQRVHIHLQKRRHVCPVCGKRFYESIESLPKYYRMTIRLIAFILKEFEDIQSMSTIAKRANVSGQTVARIFDHVQHPKPDLPEAISIDEFRGNAGGERFQCLLTDPSKKEVLDVLPDRKAETLYGYFSTINNRKDIRYVVMDMSAHFRTIAKTCFPKATIVADRFHVVRQVCWAMENVRKEEQKKFHGNRRKYFKRSRTLLLKHHDELSESQIQRVNIMLQTSQRLSRAYGVLQDFYKLMDCTGSKQARKHLGAWMMRVQSYDLPEFQPCITAITNWTKEILASFDCGLSNGYTEGVNNKIKVIKRVSFGVQRFDRLRNRILFNMGS